MNINIFLFILSIGFLSCSSSKQRDCKSIVKNNVGRLYSIDLVCDYKTKITEKIDSGNQLLVVTYNDNSKVFVTNEIEYCPSFSMLFLSEKQTGMFAFNEQLTLYGAKDNLTSWRIEKRDGFILGYYDVPNEAENKYEKILLSLKIK